MNAGAVAVRLVCVVLVCVGWLLVVAVAVGGELLVVATELEPDWLEIDTVLVAAEPQPAIATKALSKNGVAAIGVVLIVLLFAGLGPQSS